MSRITLEYTLNFVIGTPSDILIVKDRLKTLLASESEFKFDYENDKVTHVFSILEDQARKFSTFSNLMQDALQPEIYVGVDVVQTGRFFSYQSIVEEDDILLYEY